MGHSHNKGVKQMSGKKKYEPELNNGWKLRKIIKIKHSELTIENKTQ
jgi:hypothetical protein